MTQNGNQTDLSLVPGKAGHHDCSRWLKVFNNLNYDPARGIAPHKPLLLLVLCDLAEEGKLGSRILPRSGDLAFRFSSYFRVVAPRRGTKPDVRLPFFHLRTEGVWRPLEPDGRIAEDRQRTTAVEIDASLMKCLQDPDFRFMSRRLLIARYFQPQERAKLYGLTGISIPNEDTVAADATRYQSSSDSEAKRDAKFAVRVLPAYDYTCALTRYRMIAVDGTTPLDAAHIHQFKRGGSNAPTNGIALCKTAHWLFDRGFWSIADDLTVLVATDRFDEAGPEAHLLKRMARSPLLQPSNRCFRPDPVCLAWHRAFHRFN